MPRKYLRKVLPNADHIRKIWGMSWVEHWIRNQNLWHINRRSISLGTAVGLFCAFLPIPVQTPLAAVVAVLVHANLPLSVILVWISNPFTIIPLYGSAYVVGAHILGEDVSTLTQFTASAIGHNLAALWVGCLLFSTVSALLGWLAVRGYWNWYVRSSWAARKRERHNLKNKKIA